MTNHVKTKTFSNTLRQRRATICILGSIAGFVPVHLPGQTWELVPDSLGGGCGGLTCSGDGSILYALVGDDGGLQSSTNGGAAWTSLLQNAGLTVSCSADGSKIAAGFFPWLSTNSGLAFAQETVEGNVSVWS